MSLRIIYEFPGTREPMSVPTSLGEVEAKKHARMIGKGQGATIYRLVNADTGEVVWSEPLK